MWTCFHVLLGDYYTENYLKIKKIKNSGSYDQFQLFPLKMHFNVLLLNICCRVIAQNAQKTSGSPYILLKKIIYKIVKKSYFEKI